MTTPHKSPGLQFPEGPIAMPDGSVIRSIARETLTRVMPDGKQHIVARCPAASAR
jgi:gluconolactonase